MKKTPFVTLEKALEIAANVPTPYHLYDEAGIRRNARALREAFAWNAGFKEYFAVKATPNPYILSILHEEGCGCDCATYTELLLAEACGITGKEVMFSSNVTPVRDMKKAFDMGAYINLDDASYVERSCRYPQDGLLPLQPGRELFLRQYHHGYAPRREIRHD